MTEKKHPNEPDDLEDVIAHLDKIEPDGEVNQIDTDYKVGQDNVSFKLGRYGFDIHNPVFGTAGGAIILFVILTLMFQTQAEPLFGPLRNWLTSNLDWFFISAGNIFVLVCLGLVVSPLGRVRIGGIAGHGGFNRFSLYHYPVNQLLVTHQRTGIRTAQQLIFC